MNRCFNVFKKVTREFLGGCSKGFHDWQYFINHDEKTLKYCKNIRRCNEFGCYIAEMEVNNKWYKLSDFDFGMSFEEKKRWNLKNIIKVIEG